MPIENVTAIARGSVVFLQRKQEFMGLRKETKKENFISETNPVALDDFDH
jgi:hypothetical protein